jgi:hypothetical protein
MCNYAPLSNSLCSLSLGNHGNKSSHILIVSSLKPVGKLFQISIFTRVVTLSISLVMGPTNSQLLLSRFCATINDCCKSDRGLLSIWVQKQEQTRRKSNPGMMRAPGPRIFLFCLKAWWFQSVFSGLLSTFNSSTLCKKLQSPGFAMFKSALQCSKVQLVIFFAFGQFEWLQTFLKSCALYSSYSLLVWIIGMQA